MTQKNNQVMSLINSGNFLKAKQACLIACRNQPENAENWFTLSAICGHLQDFKSAEKYCRKAIELNPFVATAYYNLAVTLRSQRKLHEAVNSLKKAVELQKNFSAALFELGNIHYEITEYKQAIEYYKETIASKPDAYQAYTGIAAALQQLDDNQSAISAYLESLRIKPDQQGVVIKLASIYDNEKDIDKAINCYKHAIKIGYQKVDVFINLGRMLALKNSFDEAEQYYKKALLIDPKSIEAITNLALLYDEIRNSSKAFECIEKANQIGSDDERFIYNRAKILTSVYKYTEAEKLYKNILKKNARFCEAAVNLGNIYLLSGRVDAAHNMYLHACECRPDYHEACSNMLMSLNYNSDFNNAAIRDMHLAWAKSIESNEKTLESLKINSTKSCSVKKVGYVSPDFRNHSVAFFIEGILKHSDKNRVVNYCYSDVRNKDSVTQKLYRFADYWRDVSMLDHEALASLIRKDNIDILIDLCGHMSGNRLPAFALKPAPIQITYLGYPNTTGLSSMDYRIVDKITDPAGSELMMSEDPLYIAPGFLAYTPYQNSPDVAVLPALSAGYVTFGSFNSLAKITQEVINIWSRILTSVPQSRLCIKARQFADEAIKSDFTERFSEKGVDQDALELLPYEATIKEHLETYSKIDIALDTFPYNGTTTTLESLWMGVPVVCNTGDRHSSRVGASILTNTGLESFLAKDTDEYIKIAIGLANDFERLDEIRKGLRLTMETSVLLNTKEFTSNYESLMLNLFN